MLNEFKTEIELEMATIPFIKKYFKNWSWQMPHYGYVCDFMGIDFKNRLIAIEYKLKDWKGAIEQTRHHFGCADFVYILLPEGNWINKAIEYIKNGKFTTGILCFNGSIKIILKPKWQNKYIWKPIYKQQKQWIKEIALHDRMANVE